MLPRSLVRGSCKSRVTAPTPPALRHHNTFIGPREVMHLLTRVGVIQNCSHGNFQSDVRAFTSRLVRTFSVTSALRFVLRIETEMHQSIVALARLHDHVATLATISARRPTPRHILLPPESNTTITAIPSLHPDFRFINKQSRYSPNPRDNPRGNGHPARLSRAKRGAPPPHAMRPRTPAL